MLFAAVAATVGAGVSPAPSAAQTGRPSSATSFPLGSSRGVLCTAQASDADPVLRDMFDRGFAVTCRDAALPVARLYVLRRRGEDPLTRLATAREGRAVCGAARTVPIEDIGSVQATDCTLKQADVGYRVYVRSDARATYVAEGLAGYDSVLTIGLRTLVADAPVQGEVTIAATGAGDPAAFARLQAGSLSIREATSEGYRRNNSGDYAEASEFFASLLGRGANDADAGLRNEFLVNRALQESNLANFEQSEALFLQAEAIVTRDPVQLRLRRNFRALDLLNQGRIADAQAVLERPIAAVLEAPKVDAAGGIEIDAATATQINAGASSAQRFGGDTELTALERTKVLDAQAQLLHGTARRLQGDTAGAAADFQRASAEIATVRGGRVSATARLQAQIIVEQARLAETRGDLIGAEALFRQSQAAIDRRYPQSAASRAGQIRLASFLARHGKTEEALTLFRALVTAAAAGDGGGITSAMLAPYFELLAAQLPTRPELVADIFLASETTVRPGVAATQSILARELSAGGGDASRLFRQAVTLNRDVERTRIELAGLNAMTQPQPMDRMRAASLTAALDRLAEEQVATQARLSNFAQYRAISNAAISLPELQKVLGDDEAYLKLVVINDAVYALFATKTDATAYKAGIGATALDQTVDQLRDSITIERDGQQLTYPFDLALSHTLYTALIAPVETRLTGIKHLVFEPDGGMLRLPVNLLAADQASVDAHQAQAARPGGDPFDYRGVKWLGRSLAITTAVSARAFRDVRATPPSKGKAEYLGFGQNAPVSATTSVALNRSAATVGALDCNFPLDAWNQPVSASELNTAQQIVGARGAQVITGEAFSDTELLGKKDLNDYRVLHFATHGLVRGPYAGCPAQPALLTSFGGPQSDGLLTFREIYDMRIDADLVILSACDTAGAASVAATRAAGVTSGGGFALDGLVRAFVGAGGRTVVASHWPVPNEFDATQRLIAGIFQVPPGVSIADALRQSELALMDQAETSHPFYWAAFAVIGDGEAPVLRRN